MFTILKSQNAQKYNITKLFDVNRKKTRQHVPVSTARKVVFFLISFTINPFSYVRAVD